MTQHEYRKWHPVLWRHQTARHWRHFQRLFLHARIGVSTSWYRPRAPYQIRKIAGCTCAGNAGNVFSNIDSKWKPLISDIGMHHDTCVTHVPRCMSGSLIRGGRENIPGACAFRNFAYLVKSPWISIFHHQIFIVRIYHPKLSWQIKHN